jgi:hypothetical protein
MGNLNVTVKCTLFFSPKVHNHIKVKDYRGNAKYSSPQLVEKLSIKSDNYILILLLSYHLHITILQYKFALLIFQ